MPYAWQVRGQPCACLPAERGPGGGHSVLGFWQPADPQATGRQAFTAIVSVTAFTAELFVLAVDELVAHQREPTVLMLDNASIHKSYLVQAQVATWAAQGVTLLLLPPYFPELNRIEIRRRFCKHYWLTPDAYQTTQSLLQQFTDLLRVIGTPEHQNTRLLLVDYLIRVQVQRASHHIAPKRTNQPNDYVTSVTSTPLFSSYLVLIAEDTFVWENPIDLSNCLCHRGKISCCSSAELI